MCATCDELLCITHGTYGNYEKNNGNNQGVARRVGAAGKGKCPRSCSGRQWFGRRSAHKMTEQTEPQGGHPGRIYVRNLYNMMK